MTLNNSDIQKELGRKTPLYVPCPCTLPNVVKFDARHIGRCATCGYEISRLLYEKRKNAIQAKIKRTYFG